MKHISLAAIVLVASNLALALTQETPTGGRSNIANTETPAIYVQEMAAFAASLEEVAENDLQEKNMPIP